MTQSKVDSGVLARRRRRWLLLPLLLLRLDSAHTHTRDPFASAFGTSCLIIITAFQPYSPPPPSQRHAHIHQNAPPSPPTPTALKPLPRCISPPSPPPHRRHAAAESAQQVHPHPHLHLHRLLPLPPPTLYIVPPPPTLRATHATAAHPLATSPPLSVAADVLRFSRRPPPPHAACAPRARCGSPAPPERCILQRSNTGARQGCQLLCKCLRRVLRPPKRSSTL